MIEIRIPGQPVPKGRARSTRDGHHYTPKRTRDWEHQAKILALVAMREAGMFTPILGPIVLSYLAIMPIPKSWAKHAKEVAIDSRHTTRPDLDNLLKAALDACNGVVWHDDTQVCDIAASKRYGTEPCVRITVEPAQ